MVFTLRNKPWFRGVIGFVAAYVFALQVLLTGVVATQMAFAPFVGGTEVCHDRGALSDESSDKNNATHPCCAICAFASVTPLASETTQDVPHPVSYSALQFIAEAPYAASVSFPATPRLSQGPPRIV